jgi:ATP-dependent protease ClpP protease subunit
MQYFTARYKVNGIQRSYRFDKSEFTRESAERWLQNKGIQNFMLFFEPNDPQPFGENSLIFSGEVGFDITADNIANAINDGKDIIINSFGGSLYEAWLIYDTIKQMDINPNIGVMGISASAATLITLATNNSWATENSRFLIHNPWSMTAGDDEVMRAEAKALEKEKMELAKLYANVSGRDINEILDIMKREEFLTAPEALELKLINSINVKQKEEEKMANEKVTMLDSIIEKANNLLNRISAVKNMTLVDTNGNEFEVEREDGEPQVGDAASPDGTYTMENGNTIVVEGGIITAINEPAPEEGEDAEALKARIAELEAEIASLKGMANEVNNMIAELRKIKSKVVVEDRQQNFKQEPKAKTVDFEKVREIADKLKK